jgi:hypothetical protein
MKDKFSGMPIPVGGMLESEAVTMTRCLQPRCAIDEEGRVDEMFLAEF